MMKCEACGLMMFKDSKISSEKTKTMNYSCKNKSCQMSGTKGRGTKFFCCDKPLLKIRSTSFVIASRAEDYFEQISDKLYITCPDCREEHIFDVTGKVLQIDRF